jgi:large subunit ribosomal protein L17
LILKHIKQKGVVKELFDEVAPKYLDRPGGYTRITKIGQRNTDAADMAFIELIGFEGIYKKRKEASEEKRRKKKEKEKEQEKQMQEMDQQAAMEAQAESAVEEGEEEKKEENEESK